MPWLIFQSYCVATKSTVCPSGSFAIFAMKRAIDVTAAAVGLVVSALIAVYLLYALLRGDRF